MTYTDFLKNHFGEDGSLARVLESVGDYGFLDGCIAEIGHRIHDEGLGIDGIQYSYVCDRDLFFDLYDQSTKTQRKIAELLGWKE